MGTKCQVIFLNRWLDCPEEKLKIHAKMQQNIQEARAVFDMDVRDYNPYQRAISKMKSHNLCKGRIKLVAPESLTEDEEENSI